MERFEKPHVRVAGAGYVDESAVLRRGLRRLMPPMVCETSSLVWAKIQQFTGRPNSAKLVLRPQP